MNKPVALDSSAYITGSPSIKVNTECKHFDVIVCLSVGSPSVNTLADSIPSIASSIEQRVLKLGSVIFLSVSHIVKENINPFAKSPNHGLICDRIVVV